VDRNVPPVDSSLHVISDLVPVPFFRWLFTISAVVVSLRSLSFSLSPFVVCALFIQSFPSLAVSPRLCVCVCVCVCVFFLLSASYREQAAQLLLTNAPDLTSYRQDADGAFVSHHSASFDCCGVVGLGVLCRVLCAL
jgi:hypothetical protein